MRFSLRRTARGQAEKIQNTWTTDTFGLLNSEKIQVEYCPTEMMLADFFTKPLQGALFRKFRDVVLGYKHIDDLKQTTEEASSQERVGNQTRSDFLEGDGNRPSVVRKKSYADAAKRN